MDYLKFKHINSFDVPVQGLNKEYFNSIKNPHLIGNLHFFFFKIHKIPFSSDCSLLFGFIVFAHDNSFF